MFEFISDRFQNQRNFVFYKVNDSEITNSEKRMGMKFPASLAIFYREIGYGFIKGEPYFINRIMAPDDIADFVCGEEEYAYVDKSIYGPNSLVFLHISDEDFLTIDYEDGKEGCIRYFGGVIANSFIEFLEKALKILITIFEGCCYVNLK